jgi:FlaA1/EpsC-like NDP-sugar epimerase
MLRQLKNPRFHAMIVIDAVGFTTALILAYGFRFEFNLTCVQTQAILAMLPVFVAGKLVVFWFFKLYKVMWRYSSLGDVWRLAQACMVSTLLSVSIVVYSTTFQGCSRSLFLLDGILTFLLAGGIRVAVRFCHAILTGRQEIHGLSFRSGNSGRVPKRVVILGAGAAGEKLLREIFDNPHLNYRVAGFLDDDPGKRGRAIHGVPVLGLIDKLPAVIRKREIEQVFISMPSATGAQMRRVVEICKDCNISYKTLPAIGQIIDGNISVKTLRDVNYEDLLRRQPVTLDEIGIENYIKGRKVLVTGAGGSIGSELCRQLTRFHCEKLILIDAGEANLYGIQMELRHELNFGAYHPVLAKVQDKRIMENVFRTYRPDIVFHAAAYKHVPLLERNPWEAIFNNVVGSQVVIDMASEYEAKKFVLVSTDKAVRPTNVMGTSKRVAELLLQSAQSNGTRFMTVRFGNVLASSGSVVPLFHKQIEHGGPVTVTHPEVTRYFMTIPEAAQLILQAAAMGEGGEIFVLKMGTPVKIVDLATDLIRLSGKMPGRDIEIVYSGLRPGEKLYEELITGGEDVVRTSHEKIMLLKCKGKLNGNGVHQRQDFGNRLKYELEDLCRIAKTYDACAIKGKLKQLVPEYNPEDMD